jgi:oxaloacetate decarboxylase alpha subunit
MKTLSADLYHKAEDKAIEIHGIEDVLTYALFPQVGLKFLENRNNPAAFEPPPGKDEAAKSAPADAQAAHAAPAGPERYQVTVNGRIYAVEVAAGGAIHSIEAKAQAGATAAPALAAPEAAAEPVNSPLTGTIVKVLVRRGLPVRKGDIVIILEAMKMETEIRAPRDGEISDIAVREGDAVEVGRKLLELR